jgi:colanic acid biosynthesis glycosyl transferase WcaI
MLRHDDSADKIIIVTRHYAPEPTGSAPVLQETAEWIAATGVPVDVITVRPSYPTEDIFEGYANGENDRAIENGVHIRRWAAAPVHGTKLSARIVPETRFLLQLLVNRLTGNIAQSQKLISLCPSILTVLGALPLRARGGRHVVIVHDIQSGLGAALEGSGLMMSVLRRVESWTLNRVDHIVVLSAAMEQALRNLGVRTPALVVHPHIDTETIVPYPRPDGAPPTCMYSGNLGRKQGLDQLLDMAAVLRNLAPDVRVLIRGEGAMRKQLVERAGSLGLINVQFEPLVAKQEVARSLAEGDVHLVPQLPGGREFAVPSKAFAVMAAGRPFVATAESGSPLAQLADSVGAGVCVDTGDIQAFAGATLQLLRDDHRRAQMGAAGRAYVEAEADTKVVMSRIRALLN